MKFKLLKHLILKALFLAFLSPSVLSAEDVVEIDVCYINKMNPPYVLNPNVLDNGYPGITIDFLKLVEIESGVKFNFITQPWHQCLEDLKHNRINATFHASYTKERSEYSEYPSNNG